MSSYIFSWSYCLTQLRTKVKEKLLSLMEQTVQDLMKYLDSVYLNQHLVTMVMLCISHNLDVQIGAYT